VRLAVPRETRPEERRVGLVPEVARRLVAGGWEVCIEAGAGAGAAFPDDLYRAAGCAIAPDAATAHAGAAAVVRVNAPTAEEARLVPERAVTLSFFDPVASHEALVVLSERRATVFSFDLLPRISRAQTMDALSSQATVVGYQAALAAAARFDRFFPMLMTAAGTVPPAKVLVMGAGVAGLQAIATSRRLGALVRAYDVRAAAREEAESLGATFVELGVLAEGAGGYARELSDDELAKVHEALAKEIAGTDVVITTAAVPGRRAPVLVTADMVEGMGPGSIIVDAATDSGGNCELTEPGQEREVGGVSVIGLSNPAAAMPTHASFLYARNVANLLSLLVRDGDVNPDWGDEIVAGCGVLRCGELVDQATAERLGRPVAAPAGSGADAKVASVEEGEQ
jgi:NAD(P) transhydrogenase subunit alpha